MHSEDIYIRKIQRLRPGLNPQTWVPEASMLTTRPPKSSTVGSISDMVSNLRHMSSIYNRGAGKSLALPGRKQATATEDSDVHISYL